MLSEIHGDLTNRTLGLACRVAPAIANKDFKSGDALSEVGLTSLDLVNLMLALESEFDIMIPASLLKPENFRSIDTITRMVEAVRTGQLQ